MSDTVDPVTARLHGTTDAAVWAEEFCRRFEVVAHDPKLPPATPDDVFGLMLGWFANAIETGRGVATKITPAVSPSADFWSVVDDVCTQADRRWRDYPYDKWAEVQVVRSDIAELRAALGRPS